MIKTPFYSSSFLGVVNSISHLFHWIAVDFVNIPFTAIECVKNYFLRSISTHLW